ASGPAWLVAGSFQVTVVAGMLCAPLLYTDSRARIPRAAFGVGLLIVAGVLLMQLGHAKGSLDAKAWIAMLCVMASAFAYPLGNRGLLLHLERSGETLNATQRVFGLALASQPAWWACAVFAWTQAGPPAASQLWLAAGVASSAGVVATILFFQASGMVRQNATALGAVEAMQAAEVMFAMLLGALFLGESWPRGQAMAGALMVVAGIGLFAWVVAHDARRGTREADALQGDRGS
ncbi:MAG: multidrug resistance efflux transporter family protein, partial [Lysobacteraceae bacterium]